MDLSRLVDTLLQRVVDRAPLNSACLLHGFRASLDAAMLGHAGGHWLADPILGSPLTLFRVAVAGTSATHFGGDECPASLTHTLLRVVDRAPSAIGMSLAWIGGFHRGRQCSAQFGLSIGRVRVRCGELSSPEPKEGDRRALETHPARLTCFTHSRKYKEAEIGV